MPNAERSPNVVYSNNLAYLGTAVSAGAQAVLKVLGDEATSTHVDGEKLSRSAIENSLAAQLAKSTGA